jgi:hypothetical protein
VAAGHAGRHLDSKLIDSRMNWLTRSQAEALINLPDPATLKGKRKRRVAGKKRPDPGPTAQVLFASIAGSCRGFAGLFGGGIARGAAEI